MGNQEMSAPTPKSAPDRIPQSEMSQQDFGSSYGAASIPQKLVRLVGCYDPAARLRAKLKLAAGSAEREIAK